MKKIRILVSLHILPTGDHLTTMLFKNILPILQKNLDVELFWLVYLPERISEIDIPQTNSTIIDIHDYKNCVDVVQKIKPDIIFDNEHPSLIDLATDFAGKFLNIPVVTGYYKRISARPTKFRLAKNYLTKFFHSTIPGTHYQEKKSPLRRGRFFIYKFLFLMKTLKATNVSNLDLIKYFFLILRINLSVKRPFIDSRFANSLQWLPGPYLYKPLIDAGYPESSLVVTGYPIYDQTIKKITNYSQEKRKNNQIKVLFVPIQMYEIGLWSKKEHQVNLKETIKSLSNNKEFSLSVKIHPSSSILAYYESIIHKIDSKIPIYQKGEVVDYLLDADVVISFPSASTAIIHALMAKKPVILCDFFNIGVGEVLEQGIGVHCTNPDDLPTLVKNVSLNNSSSGPAYDKFMQDYFYKNDGKSSERLCDAILNLLQRSQ